MGPALRLSCRSELHVLPRFPVAQTIRSPDYDELSSPHRFFAVRAGVLWLRLPSRDLTPESLRGSESLRILPSVLPVTSLHETSFGLHRFEPVVGAVLPPSWAMSLTRQGISLIVFFHVKPHRTNNVFLSHCSCMSPCRWDYIFTAEVQVPRQCLACSL